MAERLSADGVDRIKPAGGQVLAGATIALAAMAGAAITAEIGASALWKAWPWLVLVGGGAWALYWRPEVAVSDGGVRLVNVLHTVDVPWPALRGVETKWALTLDTVWGSYRAWAAPAPGRSAMKRELRDQRSLARSIDRRVPTLPPNTMGRTGDLLYTESGAAAMLVHGRWSRLRDAGHLDGAVLEHDRPQLRWHWELLTAAAVLLAVGVLGVAL